MEVEVGLSGEREGVRFVGKCTYGVDWNKWGNVMTRAKVIKGSRRTKRTTWDTHIQQEAQKERDRDREKAARTLGEELPALSL